MERILADGEAPFLIGGKALTLRRHFIEDVRAVDLHEQIRTLRRALLVMHSPTDNTVGIANASEIFRAARHPRSFVSLEGADHLLTGRNQAKRAARIISAWADPYLGDDCTLRSLNAYLSGVSLARRRCNGDSCAPLR